MSGNEIAVADAAFWTSADSKFLARLPVAAVLACAVPRSRWPALARRVVRGGLVGKVSVESEMKLVGRHMGTRVDRDGLRVIAEDSMVHQRLLQLFALRTLLRPGWRPPTRLEGRAHVDAALVRGKGAILWQLPMTHASVGGKMALAMGGVRAHHLSRFLHPYTDSRLGARLLNPIRTIPENRFLASRVTIPRGESPLVALRRLGRLLAGNEVVSIMVGGLADRPEALPFLDRPIAMAAGPPRLAARSGAALLPVTTLLEGDVIVTTIHPPIDGAPAMAALMAETVQACPGQWLWRDRMFAS